jgi:hypothetical protein
MLSNAAYAHKLNKSQKVIEEGSAEMVAQFRIGLVPYNIG